MRRFVLALAAVVALAPSAFGLKVVNGREVPQSTDFGSYGASFQNIMSHIDTLLTEVADLLPTAEGSDAINVDSVMVTKLSVSDTAFIDTLTTTIIKGTWGSFSDSVFIDTLTTSKLNGTWASFSDSVFIDTLATSALRVGGSGSLIIGMTLTDATNDTLAITIGAKTWQFVPVADK